MSRQKYTIIDLEQAMNWGIPDGINICEYDFWLVSCNLGHLQDYSRRNIKTSNSETVTYTGNLVDNPGDIIFTKKNITVINKLHVNIGGTNTRTSFRIEYVIARKK